MQVEIPLKECVKKRDMSIKKIKLLKKSETTPIIITAACVV
jgi:hypothetical protein